MGYFNNLNKNSKKMPKKKIRIILLSTILGLTVVFSISLQTGIGLKYWYPIVKRILQYSVQDRLDQYESKVKERLAPYFEKANVQWPGEKAIFLTIKNEKRLELWVKDKEDQYKFVKEYSVKAASGVLGPKLQEGDYQVPEGFYNIVFLHPNSTYHLSMKLNYPNTADKAQAKKEGRTNLGDLIYIHGKAVSIGCIAVGDPAIEELFVLGALLGKNNLMAINVPLDFRYKYDPKLIEKQEEWVKKRYKKLSQFLNEKIKKNTENPKQNGP